MRRYRRVTAVVVMTACTVYSVRVQDVSTSAPTEVTTPVKAHLTDGSIVLYRTGVKVGATALTGRGVRYAPSLAESTVVDLVQLDSVVAMESFRDRIEPVGTMFGVLGGAVLVVGAAVAIACATDPKCFGSCPTVYRDSAGTALLEAEGFSYSIAPLFEARDVDRLVAQPDSLGTMRLEVRNEALETHDINHMELIEVTHGPGEVVVPDSRGQAIAVAGLRPVTRAVDRAQRDVTDLIARHDGVFFKTDSAVLARAAAGDVEDALDLTVPVAPGADSVALVFRMRNSLLSTVLLYDMMLGDRGPFAFHYVANTLEEIGHAVELGRFAREELGMRIATVEGGTVRPVARIPDTGPVAWKDVVVLVPAPATDTLRLRLTFPADAWRIDRVAAATTWQRPAGRTIPLSRVVDGAGHPDTAALASLAAVDRRYLETRAGQYFFAEFDAGTVTTGTARTFLLSWQGYYTEWIRRAWLQRGRDSTAFAPGRPALVQALARWRASQDSTERLFYATRVPVR